MSIFDRFFKKTKNKEQHEQTNHLLDHYAPIAIETNSHHMNMGDYIQSLVLIMDYPSHVEHAWLAKIATIDGTAFSLHVYPSDSLKLKKMLDKSIAELEGRIATNILPPMENRKLEQQLEDAYGIIDRIVKNNEKLYYMTCIIQVYAKNKEALDAKVREVETILSADGMRGRIAAHLQNESFLSVAPVGICDHKIIPIASRNAMMDVIASSFPFIYSGINDGDGVLMGKDLSGGIALIDFWKRDKDRGNGNVVVAGRSGTGKSTMLKKAILSEYARGTKVIILDPEREFQDMAIKLNGNWMNCGLGSSNKINPLQIRAVPEDGAEEEQLHVSAFAAHISTLRTFFHLYLRDLSSFEVNILEESIEEVYAKFEITPQTDVSKLKPSDYPTIFDLYTHIENKIKDPAIYEEDKKTLRNLRVRLRPAARGSDQSLWNGHSTLQTDSDFVVLDIHNLIESSENIKRAQMFNVMSYIWNEIVTNPDQPKMIVCDEAHLLLDANVTSAAAFLRNVVKRIRKYEGILVTCSQNFNDFLDPSVAKYGLALLENSCYHFIFGLGDNELKSLVPVMHLSEREELILREGRRGECLAKIGQKRIHLKVDVSDYELKLFGKKGGR